MDRAIPTPPASAEAEDAEEERRENVSSTSESSTSEQSVNAGVGFAGSFGGFLFGVATAGFQVEGGYNRPGEVGNNWQAWEQAGRVEPSGRAVGFWDRPEEVLDRVASLGCDSFRLGVEWARVAPDPSTVDRAALGRYADIVAGCRDRGIEPLVTLHHFTHPAWLGEDFWLRPDAQRRYRAWTELVVEALAPSVRYWVTINEINILSIGSWLLGMFPPGRLLAYRDAAIALDNMLAAHVSGYEVIHEARPDALVTTNNFCLSVYEYDRLLTDLLLCRRFGIEPEDVGEWLADRRRLHDSLVPAGRAGEGLLRRMTVRATTDWLGKTSARGRLPSARSVPWSPRRALEAVYASDHPCTLDVVGIDYYDPVVSRHFRLPGTRTAGGRDPRPTRELWDDVPEPAGLNRRLHLECRLAPELPIWVLENGLCNRVRNGRAYARLDGWDRPRYLRENIAAVVNAVDAGVPVQGYWHWSLVDNYEWGSYEPRFGLFGIDRDRGDGDAAWLDKDSMGDDSASAYGQVVAGLRSGDRSVLDGP